VLYGISCATSSQCEAVGANEVNGQGVVVSVSNGVAGTPHVVPDTKALTGIFCESATSCDAVGLGQGHGVMVAIDNGEPGSPQKVSELSSFAAISCSGSVCEGGGRAVLAGAIASGPTTVLTVPGTTSIDGLDCWAASTCEAIASTSNGQYNGVLVALNKGQLSPLQVVPPGTATFSGIACAGSASCVAVGSGTVRVGNHIGEQAVVVNIDAGKPTHVAHVQETKTTSLSSVACASHSSCVAVGTTGSLGTTAASVRGVYMDIVNGAPSAIRTVAGQSLQLNGISCPTTGQCWAVGENAKGAAVLSLSG
jgi:hypothetical protein